MFHFIKTSIPEVIIIEPEIYGDDRGFFFESYSKKDFISGGITANFVQDNHSKSKKGVFRGFHFQTQNTQSKLVRVISGAVLDFAIDIRKTSPTYGKYVAEELSEQNKRQLFIPKGFAHGFLTLEDDTEFVYKCDDYYSPGYDGGIIYSDPTINILFEDIKKKYEIDELFFSNKDKEHPSLEGFSPYNPF